VPWLLFALRTIRREPHCPQNTDGRAPIELPHVLVKPEALSVTLEGFDIAEFSRLPLRELVTILSGAVARLEEH